MLQVNLFEVNIYPFVYFYVIYSNLILFVICCIFSKSSFPFRVKMWTHELFYSSCYSTASLIYKGAAMMFMQLQVALLLPRRIHFYEVKCYILFRREAQASYTFDVMWTSIRGNKARSKVCSFCFIIWFSKVNSGAADTSSEIVAGSAVGPKLESSPCTMCPPFAEHGLFCIAITIATLAATWEFWGRTVILMDWK